MLDCDLVHVDRGLGLDNGLDLDAAAVLDDGSSALSECLEHQWIHSFALSTMNQHHLVDNQGSCDVGLFGLPKEAHLLLVLPTLALVLPIVLELRFSGGVLRCLSMWELERLPCE